MDRGIWDCLVDAGLDTRHLQHNCGLTMLVGWAQPSNLCEAWGERIDY